MKRAPVTLTILIICILSIMLGRCNAQTEIELYSIDLKLTIWTETNEYKLDVYPTFLVTSPLTDSLTPRFGQAIPFGILVDKDYKDKFLNGYCVDYGSEMSSYCYDDFLHEEYSHSRIQMGSLGPVFFPLYFSTMGLDKDPFEPYNARCNVGVKCNKDEREHFDWEDMNLAMLEPYKDNCSLFSLTNDSINFLPCYTMW